MKRIPISEKNIIIINNKIKSSSLINFLIFYLLIFWNLRKNPVTNMGAVLVQRHATTTHQHASHNHFLGGIHIVKTRNRISIFMWNFDITEFGVIKNDWFIKRTREQTQTCSILMCANPKVLIWVIFFIYLNYSNACQIRYHSINTTHFTLLPFFENEPMSIQLLSLKKHEYDLVIEWIVC